MDLGLRYAAEFQIPPILEFSAIILFAITGALSAARRGYDWIGTMASLLVGILINVPFRTFEFLAGVPALGGMAPDWFRMLYVMMFVDLVFLSGLYAFAFVLALRHVPLFPRFLAGVWVIDVLMQICIARVMAHVANLPGPVGASLADMLEGNLKKVLISVAIWLPYLLLSRRVNLTYRWRVPA